MKTSKELAGEIRASTSAYVTYGDGDLGIPVAREEAIMDIDVMDDDLIGDGIWYECNEFGTVTD